MQPAPPVSDHAYHVRFGLSGLDLLWIPVLLMVPLGVFYLAKGHLLPGVLMIVIAVPYPVTRLAQLTRRPVALRVDDRGLTLGKAPPWLLGERTAFVPWSDVIRVVLWGQDTRAADVRYLGVQRLEGAPPLPGSTRNRVLRAVYRPFYPARLPSQVGYDSRQIRGWRLDQEHLAAAVARFAPHVEVVRFN